MQYLIVCLRLLEQEDVDGVWQVHYQLRPAGRCSWTGLWPVRCRPQVGRDTMTDCPPGWGWNPRSIPPPLHCQTPGWATHNVLKSTKIDYFKANFVHLTENTEVWCREKLGKLNKKTFTDMHKVWDKLKEAERWINLLHVEDLHWTPLLLSCSTGRWGAAEQKRRAPSRRWGWQRRVEARGMQPWSERLERRKFKIKKRKCKCRNLRGFTPPHVHFRKQIEISQNHRSVKSC